MNDHILYQIVISSTILFTVLSFFIVYGILQYKNREQEHLLERQRLLFELENKELNMCFQERELMLGETANEVKNDIVQVASMMGMYLNSIRDDANTQKQLELIQKVIDHNRYLINKALYMGNILSSDYIKEQGLYRMLEYDLEQITQIRCHLNVEGDDRSITTEKQLMVYRIAQEAIHNALKYANAGILDIRLCYNKYEFSMLIEDNGKGFDEAEEKKKGTIGLNNMRRRAKLLNGILAIHSQPGQGCRISLTAPISD